MLVGSLVHELFQKSIHDASATKKLPNFQELISNIMNDHSLIRMCYDSEMSVNDLNKELQGFTENIEKFLIDQVIPKAYPPVSY